MFKELVSHGGTWRSIEFLGIRDVKFPTVTRECYVAKTLSNEDHRLIAIRPLDEPKIIVYDKDRKKDRKSEGK